MRLTSAVVFEFVDRQVSQRLHWPKCYQEAAQLCGIRMLLCDPLLLCLEKVARGKIRRSSKFMAQPSSHIAPTIQLIRTNIQFLAQPSCDVATYTQSLAEPSHNIWANIRRIVQPSRNLRTRTPFLVQPFCAVATHTRFLI